MRPRWSERAPADPHKLADAIERAPMSTTTASSQANRVSAEQCGDGTSLRLPESEDLAMRLLDRRPLTRTIAAIVLAAILFGCTTTRTVDVRGLSGIEGLAREVEARDRVMVKTHDGRELEFEVIRVEADALVGVTERVERNEIEELEVTRVDELRTAGGLGGGTLAILIAMGIIFVAVAPAAILSASP